MAKKRGIKKNSNKSQLKPTFYLVAGFLVLILPLIYFRRTIDPVLMPRLMLLDGFLLFVCLYFFIGKSYRELNLSIIKNPVVLLYSAFFIITLVSMLFANTLSEGFFDIVKTFTVLILIYCLILIFSQTHDWPEKLTRLFIIAALISGCIGFYQYLQNVVANPDKFLRDSRESIYLVTGIMGHKNQFSAAMMLMLPFLGYGIYRFRQFWQALSIICMVMLISLIVLLQTRSVWAGTFISVFITAIFLMVLNKKFNLSKKTKVVMAIAGFVIVSGLMGIFLIDSNPAENTYIFKIKSITNRNYGNNLHRIKTWQATARMIADHPIAGVGAGNWMINIPKYYNDRKRKIKESNWLRPHNDFLWIYAEKGILGILAFLSIMILTGMMAIKTILLNKDRHKQAFALALLSGLIAYNTISFFTFPYERINQQVCLAILISGIIALRPITPAGGKRPWSRYAYLAAAVLLLFGVVYGAAMVRMETHMKVAKRALSVNDWQTVIAEGKKAKNPFREIEPEGGPINWFIGTAYLESGNDRKAIKFLSRARKITPYNPIVLNNLGKSYFNIGDYKLASQMFLAALEIIPRYVDARINLGSTYYNMGKYWKAMKVLQRIPKRSRSYVINNNITELMKLVEEGRNKSGKK
nr:O-antigen ligase family protein [Bacteroidota bacterium]